MSVRSDSKVHASTSIRIRGVLECPRVSAKIDDTNTQESLGEHAFSHIMGPPSVCLSLTPNFQRSCLAPFTAIFGAVYVIYSHIMMILMTGIEGICNNLKEFLRILDLGRLGYTD